MVVRRATLKDLNKIGKYLDQYLRKDWFDSRQRMVNFIVDENAYLAEDDDQIIGFAVVQNNGVMIRLLIHPERRGEGIGQKLLEISKPQIIRSKTDQSTGDPSPFYEKNEFIKVGKLVGRKKNIQLMIKK